MNFLKTFENKIVDPTVELRFPGDAYLENLYITEVYIRYNRSGRTNNIQ